MLGRKDYLTTEEQIIAWKARAESEEKIFTLRLAFRYATEGKGVYQYILAGIGISICIILGYPMRVVYSLVKRVNQGG